MTGTPDVSVVIVNYNGLRFLETCLGALHEQEGPSYEVILVDNASSDGSVGFVRERFPGVTILPLEANHGFAAGNNRGAQAAQGRALVFLNNDTRVEPGWLLALWRSLACGPEVAMVTSRIVYMHDPSILDSAGDSVTRAGGAFKHGHGQPASAHLRRREVFGACGAAFLIRRDTFTEVGGFDEDFFLSHEDVDLSYRVRLRGYRCLYAPEAVVRHAGSGTLGAVSDAAVFYGQRNLEWVYVKNTPGVLLIRSLPMHLLYLAAATIYFARVGRLRPFVAAKWAALGGLPAVLRKRRAVQQNRRATAREIWALLEPGWLRRKIHEKRFERRALQTR